MAVTLTAAMAALVVALLALTSTPVCVLAAQPTWEPTWDMPKSTIFMPCNDSGFLDPVISAKWGVVDFDWSNGKRMWTQQHPMDCEERLVAQAELVKSVNEDARVWVYRNLVKALPWYTSVREKILDPAYSGFFLKFQKGGSLPNGTWHVPNCAKSLVGNPDKCTDYYHDTEQTPSNGKKSQQWPAVSPDGWLVYDPYNGVGGHLQHCDMGNHSTSCQVWALGNNFSTWQECSKAADVAMASNPLIHLFTWWMNPGSETHGACWLSQHLYEGTGGGEQGHIMGYKGPKSGQPKFKDARSYNTCEGDCDCGEGLPCGEYLWDHRNGSMLRDFLVNEFVLNPSTGLGNKAVSGFYFDDGWTDTPSKVPSWAPPSYKQCNMWSTGGATEENYYCVKDMGLTNADTTTMVLEYQTTMASVKDAVIKNGGFVWQQLKSRQASLDINDPRPPSKCKAYMRSQCKQGAMDNQTLLFEFTRKAFHDSFPLPHVVEDVAQFLLVRQEYAYMGYSWMGCIQPNGFVQGNATGWEGYPRPKEIDVDYGTPLDKVCKETGDGTGVFTRKWTKVTAAMDCNSYTGTLAMH